MSTQYHSKEHTKEHSKEHSKERTTEHFTANQGKTDVVVERVQNAPVVVEHHHHNTQTVIHPEVVREHGTTEIRQIEKPVYEHVKGSDTAFYAGKDVKVVEKAENATEAQRKIDMHNRDIQAKADISHTEHKSTTVADTKVKDVHAKHKVIEEVTPVIIRDVDHKKTIHKDEKTVEKIQHAPDVHKEELNIHHKEGHMGGFNEGYTTGTHGLKEGHTTGTHGYKEGYTTGTHGLKEGHTTGTHGYKEGYTKDTTTGFKEGHTTGTHGLKEGHATGTHGYKEGHTTGTHGLKEGHATGTHGYIEGYTKEKPGVKEGHIKGRKGEIPTRHEAKKTIE